MAHYMAELDEAKTVVRVIVCDAPEWPTEHLGGTWVETSDPYSEQRSDVTYCGPGMGYDERAVEKFADIAAPDAKLLVDYADFDAKVWIDGKIDTVRKLAVEYAVATVEEIAAIEQAKLDEAELVKGVDVAPVDR